MKCNLTKLLITFNILISSILFSYAQNLDPYLFNTSEIKYSTTTPTSTITNTLNLNKISTSTQATTTTHIHTLLTDHLNSIEKVLDFNTGEVIATSSYSSFGTLNKEGKTNSNRSFTNHQQDTDTNLI